MRKVKIISSVLCILAIISLVIGTICYINNVGNCRVHVSSWDGSVRNWSVIDNMLDPFSFEAGLFWDLGLLLLIIGIAIPLILKKIMGYTFESTPKIDTDNVCTTGLIKRTWVWGFVIGIVLCLSFGLGIAFASDMDGTVFAVISLLLCGIAVYFTDKLYNGILEKRKLLQEEYLLFDEEKEVAQLLKRGAVAANMLTCESISATSYKYNPAKLVYTGATVGGIHTGGFHTTEAYISEHYTGGSTGKGHVFIVCEKKIVGIEKIYLVGDLYQSALKNERIKKFMVDNYISFRNHGEEAKLTQTEQMALQAAIKSGNTAAQYNITQRAFIASHLDLEDIHYIINWIRSNG